MGDRNDGLRIHRFLLNAMIIFPCVISPFRRLSRISIVLGLIDAGDIITPPAYQTFTPPNMGESYIDPAFGTRVTRLTDAVAMGYNRVLHDYSSVDPFNSDSSLLVLYGEGGSGNGRFIFRRATGEVVVSRATLNTGGSVSTLFWSRTDPLTFYATRGGNQLWRGVISGSSVTWTSLRTFSGYTSISINGKGEGDISPDGDHLLILDNTLTKVVLYKISTNEVSSELDTTTSWFDFVDFTADNEVIFCSTANGAGNTQGMQVYSKNLVRLRQLVNFKGHSDRGRNLLGEPVIAVEASEDLAGACTGGNWAGAELARISDGAKVCLLNPPDFNMGVHCSLNGSFRTGWALIESYGPTLANPIGSLPGDWASNWKKYYQEILLISLDGTVRRRLVHHRSRNQGGSGYYWQPRATMSGDGAYMIFGSNMGIASPDDVTDVYLVNLTSEPNRSAPVISGINAPSPGQTSATIAWNTDKGSTSQVEWGTTTFYGGGITPLDPDRVTSHSVGVTGLSAGTLYHYRVKSIDAAGNVALSADQTLTTAS